jgi:anion-transporting  ArsA/GET3 family ATPase
VSAADLVDHLGRSRVIVCCGSGGVGKTTISAALGMGIASARARRVLVLTIDPARRLASALGLGAFGTRPVSIEPERLRQAGIAPRGELVAAMLDTRAQWDRLVARHAPSREVRDRILANRFYGGISDAFAGSQEYMALEALYDFRAGGEYDCIVVDTPPSRDALAFLDAPDRITDFVAARLLGWLAGPSQLGWRALSLAASPFLRMADRLLGSDVLAELGAFVRDLQVLYEGVRRRAAATSRLLRSPETAFAVVTTLDPQPLAEAEFLVASLRERSMRLRGVVVNRVLPDSLRDPGAAAAASVLAEDAGVAGWMASRLGEPVPAEAPKRLGGAFLALHGLARREAGQLARAGRLGRAPVARLPLAGRDVSDLEALVQIAGWLRGPA